MKKKDESLDLCSIKTFAEISGVSVDEAFEWVSKGTVPSVRLADFRMANLALTRADMNEGKTVFNSGDYSHA